ncbi:MAG: hypothetical protein KAZ30_04480 [Candidatus Magasanikbacteria bacterium]|nr:hypothetical protein [Candidatus Magasanikbacteria bacterium]
MNQNFKKLFNYTSLISIGFITLYGIWAMAGMFMFVLTIATSPLTASMESLVLDYSIWAVITALLLAPGVKLFYSEHKTVDFNVWRMIRGYWFYLVPAYGVLLGTVFYINSTLGYQMIILIELGLSVWYFVNFKKCVLK